MIDKLIDRDVFLAISGGIAILLGLSLVIYGLLFWFKQGKKISSRVEHFVVAPGSSPEDMVTRHIIAREIKGSLYNRTIRNWVKKILQLLGRFTPVRLVDDMEHKLTIAGNPYNLHAREFFAIRILVFFTCIVLAFLANRDIQTISMTSMLLGIAVIFVGLVIPDYWLKKLVRTRQDEIQRDLPDALDMLSVCASAGLGFDQSLQRISNYWATELGKEFKHVIHEMEMGVSRVVALRSLSSRLDVDALSRFISLMIQAEKVGMSYAEVLHSQAIQMRVQRQYRAKEIANKLPGKMILPIALMIFPAIIAVILGPSIPMLLDIF